MDERGGHPLVADGEVLDGTLRLRAPVTLSGNVDRAETVGFRAHCHGSLPHDRLGSAQDTSSAKAKPGHDPFKGLKRQTGPEASDPAWSFSVIR